MDSIKSGFEVSLEEILDNREQRVSFIESLRNHNQSILSYKLNIPGPIKNNELINWAFHQGLKACSHGAVDIRLFDDLKTGPEAFLLFDEPKECLKKRMINIEENHPLGRLFDLDVDGIKRSDLNVKPRQCLLCHNEASLCSRSRTHSIEELLFVIELSINKLYNEGNEGYG